MKTLKKFTLLICVLGLLNSCSTSDEDSNSSGCLECNYTIASGETAATVSSQLIGTFNLTLDFVASSTYSVPLGTRAKFTVLAKEMIIEIDGQECITLKNPITSLSATEFVFKDNCRDDYMYAISESSNGGINEVNVISISGTFLAQYK